MGCFQTKIKKIIIISFVYFFTFFSFAFAHAENLENETVLTFDDWKGIFIAFLIVAFSILLRKRILSR